MCAVAAVKALVKAVCTLYRLACGSCCRAALGVALSSRTNDERDRDREREAVIAPTLNARHVILQITAIHNCELSACVILPLDLMKRCGSACILHLQQVLAVVFSALGCCDLVLRRSLQRTHRRPGLVCSTSSLCQLG